jgi:hypothetical protein
MSERLDDRLARHYARRNNDETAAERVLARLAALPPQKHPVWTRLPGILLDWQFAPAWPRMAALACCAVLGFAIGTAGIDRMMPRANTDLAAAVFEAEPLTGARP